MDPVKLYEMLKQKPFQPVRVFLKDGRYYDIAAREFAVVGVTFLDVSSQALGAPEGICGPTTTISLDDIREVVPHNHAQSLPST